MTRRVATRKTNSPPTSNGMLAWLNSTVAWYPIKGVTRSRVARMATASVIVAGTGPSWCAVATKASSTIAHPTTIHVTGPSRRRCHRYSGANRIENGPVKPTTPTATRSSHLQRGPGSSAKKRASRKKPRLHWRKRRCHDRFCAAGIRTKPTARASRRRGSGTAVRSRSLAMNAATPAVTRMVTTFINSGAKAGGMAVGN